MQMESQILKQLNVPHTETFSYSIIIQNKKCQRL